MQRRGFVILVMIVFLSACSNSTGDEPANGGPDAVTADRVVGDDAAPDDGGADHRGPPADVTGDAAPLPDGAVDALADVGGVDTVDALGDAEEPDLPLDVAPLDVDVPPDVPPPGPGEPWTFVVVLSAPMVEKASEGGVVHVQCLTVDGVGAPMDDPGDVILSAPGGVLEGVVVSFDAPGTWAITCASEVLAIEGSATVEVIHDALDKQYLHVSERLGDLHGKLAHLAMAAAMEDEGQLGAIAAGLTALAGTCTPGFVGETDLLIPLPGGWPTADQLAAAGLGPNPDDAAFEAATSGALAAMEEITVLLAQLEGGDLDEQALAELASKGEELAAFEAALAVLDPSPVAVMDALATLEALAGSAMDAVVAQTAQTAAALAIGARQTDEGYETIEAPLSLTEMLVTFAIQQVLATIPTYNGLLKDVGKAISQMVIMLAIQDLIEASLPLPDNPPELYSIHGSAAGFVTPGNPWIAYGAGFAADPVLTVFIFIAPEFSAAINDAIWGLIDLLQNIKGLLGEENVFTAIKTAKDIVDGIKALADGIDGMGGWEHMVLSPQNVDGAGTADVFLNFPPLPTGVNCSFLPQPGVMIPVNLLVGRGESMAVNVIQEGAGACN